MSFLCHSSTMRSNKIILPCPQVSINNTITLRGPHLIYLVKSFPRLLDLSLACISPHQSSKPHPTSPSHQLSNTLTSPLSASLLRYHSSHINSASASALLPPSLHERAPQVPPLQDSHTKALFGLLVSSFASLKRVNMSGWSFSLDNCAKVRW